MAAFVFGSEELRKSLQCPSKQLQVVGMCEVELSNIYCANPTHVVVFIGRSVPRLSFPAVDHEHVEFDPICLDCLPGRPVRCLDPDAEFFVEFPNERRGHRFVTLDVATGKVPDVRIAGTIGASMTQEQLSVSSEQSGDYPHGSAIAGRERRSTHTVSMAGSEYPPSEHQRRSPNRIPERAFGRVSRIGTSACGSTGA